MAVWSFYEPDKRWTKLSWANLEVFDFKTSKRKVITSNKRLYNPNISEDGKRIVAVSFTENRNSLLVVIDIEGNIRISDENIKFISGLEEGVSINNFNIIICILMSFI